KTTKIATIGRNVSSVSLWLAGPQACAYADEISTKESPVAIGTKGCRGGALDQAARRSGGGPPPGRQTIQPVILAWRRALSRTAPATAPARPRQRGRARP